MKAQIKSNIIDYLKNETNAKTLIEINDFLHFSTSEELARLQKEINALIDEGIVYETKKQKSDYKSIGDRLSKIQSLIHQANAK